MNGRLVVVTMPGREKLYGPPPRVISEKKQL
jgi:hypothetical protein